MAIKSFKKLLNNAKEQDSYWVERAKINYSIAFNRFFEKKGITQSELAKNIGTSSAYITKVFRGDTNFTIETMVKLARSVDGELHIDIVTPKEKEEWNKIISRNKLTQSEVTTVWLNKTENKEYVRTSISTST